MVRGHLVACVCLLFTTVSLADDLVFDGGSPSGAAWESPQNWSPDQVPGASDNAYIGGDFAALLSQTGQAVNVLYVGHDTQPSPGPGTLVLNSGSFSSTTARVGTSTNVVIRNPGTYLIEGGVWHVGHGGAAIGHTANGTFNLSGGTVQSAAGMEIGLTDATGVVSMIGGTYNIVAGGMQVGQGGKGTYNIRGGTFTVADGMAVGAAAGGAGTFNINDGTALPNDGVVDILSGGLAIGAAAGSTGRGGLGAGTFTISGGGMQVGKGGAGTFNISGGTVLVADGVEVGSDGIGAGTFNFSGGTFNVPNGGMRVGKSGTGTFTMSGGTYQVVDGVEVGAAAGGAGTFNLTGGTYGIVSGGFAVGSATGSTGSAGVGSGTFLIDGGGLQVGKGGSGTFLVDGGIVQAVGGADVGDSPSGAGTFNISGGTFNVPFGGARIGKAGAGTFNVSGGTILVQDGMAVGAEPGGAGTFNMVGGTYNLESGGMVLGVDTGSSGSAGIGSGTFNITAGGLQVGKGGAGTFNINGGTILVATGVEVGSGPGGAGTFNMSGGTYGILGGGFAVGSATGSTGYAGIGSGTFLIDGGGLRVGKGGAGTFNLSGGTVRVSEGVSVGSEPGGAGTFNIGGGTVLVVGGDVNAGSTSGGRGTFNISAGVVGVRTGYVFAGNAAGGAGTFNLTGGTMYTRDGSVVVGRDGVSSNSAVVLDGAVLDANRGEVVLSGSEHASNQFAFTSGTLGNVRVFAGNLHHRGGRLDIGSGTATMALEPHFAASGEYHMYTPAELRIKIHGTAGPGIAGGHDQLVSFGGVDLDADGLGGGKVYVRVDEPLDASMIGATFVIIENYSTTVVNGVFANAAGNQVAGSNGEGFLVDYAYDSGGDQRSNDVALVLQSLATAPVPPYVPDAWKLSHWDSVYLYPGNDGDPDVDFQSNLDEYVAGTDPVDPGSFFRINDHVSDPLSAMVYIQTVTGRVYHVDGTGNLQDDNGWIPVSTNIPGFGGVHAVSDTTTAFRVYRARVNLAP